MIFLRPILIAFFVGLSAVVDAASFDRTAVMFQSGGISRDQAVAMMQAKYRARVVRAETEQEGGRVVYNIRLMAQDGSRVWSVRVDAATGREL